MHFDDPKAPTEERRGSADDRVRRSTVLIQASELAAAIAAGQPPMILAVRAPDALPEGRWGGVDRIPGSLDIHLATELSGPGGGLAGSRPLPSLVDLQESARRWGLLSHDEIVVYDHDGGLQAARAWWVLRWAGIAKVRLLDGGFAAWLAAGQRTVNAPIEPPASDIVLTPGHMPQMDTDAASRMARSGVLLDSRIAVNYEGGESAPGEPSRGHIPGALSLPAAANLDATGRFLEAAQLRALYAAAGVDITKAVGVYCGAGVSAAHDLIALASIGIDAPMYVGSWSAWSADPSRPVARGRDPG